MWRRSQSLQLSACAPRSGPVAPVVSSLLLLHDAVLQQDQSCVLFLGSGIIFLLPVQRQARNNTEFWACSWLEDLDQLPGLLENLIVI